LLLLGCWSTKTVDVESAIKVKQQFDNCKNFKRQPFNPGCQNVKNDEVAYLSESSCDAILANI
jgi:hypothetical protein